MLDLRTNSAEALLELHYRVLDELKARGLIRNASAPIGEYAELLFCQAFKWTQAERNSNWGWDAKDDAGSRFQIKSRRMVGQGSRQLGAMRNLQHRPFDHLAAVLFSRDLTIFRAAIIPLDVVHSLSVHDTYTNSYKLMLTDEVWNIPSVKDVTIQLSIAAKSRV
jgi:hypothetical protein